MKLPLSFFEKKEKPELFLSLVLRNEKVTSVVFEKQGNTIKYISSDEESFRNTIEDAQTDEFLNVLDKVITSAETSLPNNVETHKTLFGLKGSWIEEDKIKKEYLEKLKKASDELGLEPIGFLNYTESLVNLLQKEEGAPITAVIVDVGKKFITVSLIKSNKVIETKSSEIHQSAAYTVDTLLKHFQSPENLPTRVILFDSEEEDLTQEFIAHPWSKSLKFLHIPQILSLPEDASVKAMLLGASTQMGTNLLYESSQKDDMDEKHEEKIVPEEFDEKPNIIVPKEEPIVSEEQKSKDLEYVDTDNSQEFFGFVENADVAKIPIPKNEAPENVPTEVMDEKFEEIPEDVKDEEEKKMGLSVNAVLLTTKGKEILTKVLGQFKKVKFNKDFVSKILANKLYLGIFGVILVLILGFLIISAFSSKALVSIFLDSKSEEKTSQIVFSPNNPTDIKNSVISVESVSVDEQGSTTTPATGKKDVGNPSKGSVTVFNSSDSTITLSKGTTIKSSNGLSFTLDSAVTISSSSGDIFSGTTPGTANVNVTASDIGQEGNLPSGTKFSISGNSSVAAKNDNAFSGGTKKSVTVVSKDDLQKLLDTLPKNLEQKARDDLKNKVGSDKSVLADFVDETVGNKSFDKKEDDQANQVTLKATVTFDSVSYKNDDMFSFASSLFDQNQNILDKNNFSVSAKNIITDKNGDVNADLTIKAKIFPKIDTDSLSKQIAGQPLTKAKNMLSNIDLVKSVDITLSPNIPLFPKNVPSDVKKIQFKITSN
ncbi:MAG TPA: baseplate J/gp47 family protein [Candidatus Sulfotelmatobacter sp.]|nr:baseplate J/gp47 family protein [Candidatus Sulfotelmatobacter sp.]